jgi:hypothetical protein
MDVRRLVRLMTEEVEAVAILAQDGGHLGSLTKRFKCVDWLPLLKRLKFL